MPYSPDTQNEIFESVQERVIGRTEKLTHFEEGSLNHVLGYHAFAGYFSLYEHALLAMQFSAWIDTAGGPINEDDLIQRGLNPDRINLPLLNSYMDDEDLESLALQNSVERDPGDRAEGEVMFMTESDTTIVPANTRVTTSSGDFNERPYEYQTTEEVSPEEGTTGVAAPVEALEIGPEYNTGAGTVTEIPNPPAGVRDVYNPNPIVGGEPPETNDELRARAKASNTNQSGGGTAAGITGELVNQLEGVDADGVYIDEFFDPPSGSPYVEVTVDGGDDDRVEFLVEDKEGLRPTGVRHIANRPTRYYVNITATLVGAPINVDRVESEISRYLAELGLGENVNRAQLIKFIMNADDDIENITALEMRTDETGLIEGDFEIGPAEKADAGTITAET